MENFDTVKEIGFTNNMPVWIVLGIIALLVAIYIIYRFPKQEILGDKDQILYELLSNKKYKNYTIIDFLRAASKKYPKKCALKIKSNKTWKSVTYFKYYENVVNFSQSLNYWMGSNVNVAIIGVNSPGWFYAHLGCMLNGGISVGLYPTNTADACKKIIQHSAIEVLVVDDDSQLKKFVNMNIDTIKLIVYYSPVKSSIVEKFRNIPVISMGSFMSEKNRNNKQTSIGNVATLIYTSGTTGKPKGAIITHKNIMASSRELLNMINTKSTINKFTNEHFISYLPLNHIAAQLMDIYIPIMTIGTVWFADSGILRNGSICGIIKEVRPTVFVGVPRIWEKLSSEIENELNLQGFGSSITKIISPWKIIKTIGFDRCKMPITTGASMSQKAKYFFSSVGINLMDIYGMSETTGPISLSLPGLSKVASVGAPIMKIKITKNNEILVKGDNLSPGYFQNEAETAKVFMKDGWFKTGDLGNIDNEGFLYVIGREKDIIVTSNGEKIPPVFIEDKLKDSIGKYFENIILIGNGRKYISVLLFTENEATLPKNIDVIIQNAINNTNYYAQSEAHTIKKFLIIKSKLKIGDDMTPTYKIKRSAIERKYLSKIDRLYKD